MLRLAVLSGVTLELVYLVRPPHRIIDSSPNFVSRLMEY
jgi:hypothetical protein